MMTISWKSQQGEGKYSLQFETNHKEEYKLVEKAAQMAVDGKTIADITEVRYGRWRYEGDYKACSLCGTYVEWNTLGTNHWNYCPYCGAKMDGGDESKCNFYPEKRMKTHTKKCCKKCRVKVSKEFAERLKKKAEKRTSDVYGKRVYLKDIDNLVQEMENEENGRIYRAKSVVERH